jgi:hypothetical protein
MSEVNAYVWHDFSGRIIAVGRLLESASEKVVPLTTKASDGVIEITVAAAQLDTLHLTHRVDMENQRLLQVSEESAD